MIWTWAALMPHPPVIVPQVGQGREREAAATLAGTAVLVRRLRERHQPLSEEPPQARQGARTPKPDCLLLLSPHYAYTPGALGINIALHMRGSLARFGAPAVAFDLQTPLEAVEALSAHLRASGIPITFSETPDITPDHGSLVPLHALASCFPHGLPPVVMANPVGLAPREALNLGRALGAFADRRIWALLASGDLSHRLHPGAPAGFSPEGAVFDRTVVEALSAGDADRLLALSPGTVRDAGECGLCSVLALLGLCGGPLEVLSYEGPFGVGYCNALWIPPGEAAQDGPASGRPPEHPHPRLARMMVQAYLSGRGDVLPASDVSAFDDSGRLWNTPKGCFVSIKTQAGALRGCIGTITPTRASLDREIMANAIAAATRDPRFPPMSPDELDGVLFSVDVLNPPEPVSSLGDLDPAQWGVIVSAGGRRGLLLPDLPGVDTVERQVGIAMRKGGITSLDGATLQRFSVSRYPEE